MRIWATVALMCFCAACHAEPAPGPEPLCFAALPRVDENTTRPLRAEEWLTLFVGASEGVVAQDCTGHAVAYPADATCNERRLTLEPLPITEDSMLTQRISYERRLVWTRTHRANNDEEVGPAAIVERTDTGWAVRAMGDVSARPGRPRLRMEMLGTQDILITEGEQCSDPEAPETCERSMRFYLRSGDRFEPASVYDDQDHTVCLGKAAVDITKIHAVGLQNGWVRSFRLASSVEYIGSTIVVHEQVVMLDSDPGQPGVPPTPFRTVDADRVLRLRAGRLISDIEPLWQRALDAFGGVAPTEEELGDADP